MWKDKVEKKGVQLVQGSNGVLRRNNWHHGLENFGNVIRLIGSP
jgi:hypothetical protein